MTPINRAPRGRVLYWIGFPVAIILMVGTITLWDLLRKAEFKQFKEQLDEAIDITVNPLQNSVESLYESVTRMGKRWQLLNGMSKEFWHKEAENYLKDFGVFKSIQVINPDMTIRWIVPKEKENWIGFDLSKIPSRQKILQQARDKKQALISNVFILSLTPGNRGFWIIVPLFIEERLDGFIIGSVAIENLFDEVFKRGIGDNYGLAVYQGNQPLFAIGGSIINPFLVASKTIKIENTNWSIYMWPTANLLQDLSTSLPWVILITGLLVALLALITSYLLDQTNIHSYRLALLKNQAERLSNRLQKILNTVTEGFLSFDKNGTIVDWNPYAEKIFGWNKKQIVGKDIYDSIISDKDKEKFRTIINAYVKGKSFPLTKNEMELEAKKFDGTPFPIEVVVLPLEIDKVGMFYIFVRDISARKKAEIDQSRLASIIEGSEDAIISVDLQGRVVTWNKGAENLYGYTSDEMIGKSITNIYTQNDKKILLPMMERLKMGNYVKNPDAVRVHKDGHYIPISIIATPMANKQGKIIGASSISRDISELKKIDKLKNEFVSTVSHELRTPLTSIRGSISLLVSGKLCELNPKAKELLEIANNNCERLIRLINDILDIEKIEAGKMTFHFKSIEVQQVIEESLRTVEETANKSAVKLKFTAPKEKIFATADPDRLTQVLVNLLANAIRFSPPDKEVEVVLTANEELVRVAIFDEGQGIPSDFKKKIFEKFSQADSSSIRKSGGTGLGLNISKAIIEKHGGTLAFESETGERTVFYFNLPRLWQPGYEKSDNSIVNNKPHVLICDANFDNASFLKELFITRNIEADIAATAQEALALLQKRKYMAITVDLLLPDQDGISFIHLLRNQESTKSIPIMVVSVDSKNGQDAISGLGVPRQSWRLLKCQPHLPRT